MKRLLFIITVLCLLVLPFHAYSQTAIDGSRQIRGGAYTKAQVDSLIAQATASISINQTISVPCSEDLTSGDIVSLINNYGTVTAKKNNLTVNTSPNGSEVVFNSAATSYCSAVALDSTRFLVAYTNDSDFRGYAKVGTVSGSSISWGTVSAAFDASGTNRQIWLSACLINTDKVLVAWDDSVTSQAKCTTLTVSGSTITVNSLTNILSGVRIGHTSLSKIDTDKAVFCYRDGSNGKGMAAIITAIGTSTPTVNTSYEFNAAATSHISVSALSSTSAIVAYQDGGNSNYGTAQVLSISGTTITPGTEYVYKEAASDWCFASALSSSTAVVGCRVDSLVTGYTFFVPDTTTALTFTSGATYDNGSYCSASKIDSTHFIFVWSGDSNYGKQAIGTISSGVISFGSIATLQSAYTYFLSAAYLGSNKSAIVYKDAGNSDYGTAVVNTWATASYDSVRGIATANTTSGSDAVVLLNGTATMNGLIPGSQYYLASDYSLSTSPVSLPIMKNNSLQTGEIFLGVGKSSTELWFNVDYK